MQLYNTFINSTRGMSWKPTVLDTEEDLLALQKQFLDSKERPAAKLSKVSITKDEKKDVSADGESALYIYIYIYIYYIYIYNFKKERMKLTQLSKR